MPTASLPATGETGSFCMEDKMKKIIITIILLLIPCVAFPCSFKPRTDEENFNAAKAIFQARIIETRLATMTNPNNPKESVEVVEGKILIKEKFKGEPPASGYVKDFVFGPGNCSLGLFTGMEYIFYTSDNDFVLMPTGSFGYLNDEGSMVRPKLEKLRELSKKK